MDRAYRRNYNPTAVRTEHSVLDRVKDTLAAPDCPFWQIVVLAFMIVSVTAFAKPTKKTNSLPPDVTVGVRVWPYSRIYPLLDGLFQDVAATQLKALSLDPNNPNGTNLDALQQVFQLQAQYSATAGIQNGLAAQQAATYSASALQQAQLVNRQSQLIQSQLITQSQVGIAQKTVDALSANGAKTSDVDTAKEQLQIANEVFGTRCNVLGSRLFPSCRPDRLSVSPLFPSRLLALTTHPYN